MAFSAKKTTTKKHSCLRISFTLKFEKYKIFESSGKNVSIFISSMKSALYVLNSKK